MIRHPVARLLPAFLLIPLLASCALSKSAREEVDAIVAEARTDELVCPAAREDRCAIASPLMELARQSQAEEQHRFTLMDHGQDALVARIHLIRAAQRDIAIQSFIFRPDDTGQLVLKELLDAARRGVHVRLILDQLFSLNDLEVLTAHALAHDNFQIRFYNPVLHKARIEGGDWVGTLFCCFRKLNQRMHNKLFVVDGEIGIVGGRNFADRYFDYDTDYNFKDRDLVVYGPLAPQMAESFEWYWQSEAVVPVQYLRDVARELRDEVPDPPPRYELKARLNPVELAAGDQEGVREKFVVPALEVNEAQYFSDMPRKANDDTAPDNTEITDAMHEVLAGARESVLIQSPYMVLSGEARRLFLELKEDHPEVELLFSTNSLASGDGQTAYAISWKHRKHYVKTIGIHLYEFKPFPDDGPDYVHRLPDLVEERKAGLRSVPDTFQPLGEDIPAPRLGLHGKSMVVDHEVAIIGTHNFDPRSEQWNTENGVIIWDPVFAALVAGAIRRDTLPHNSWVAAPKPEVPVVTPVSDAIESVSRTLPVFDIWPFRSTTLYQLAPGMGPLAPGHPEFYQRYYEVGSFPDVVATRAQVTVMMLSAFFGFLAPIL
ncbi:MAG: phospholipase D family protein [Xanthomonadales bacterium]|nr:phospholipase D family protein [Xanthomonadales bacterium]